MLEVKDLVVSYGSIKAIHGISIQVEANEIVTLIGANGAGKTTTLNTISGILSAKSGEIIYNGKNITTMAARKRVQEGLVLCPEGRQIFPRMSVDENLELGAFVEKDSQKIREKYEQVYELFPILAERRKQLGGTLSGGEQQMLAIGRALMSSPKLLMLDEPSLGLAPVFVEQIFEMILKIREMGTTILLVEQNAFAALEIADRGYVVETGLITKSGRGSDLINDETVRASYLGG